MAFGERELGEINDLFLAGDDAAAVKRVAKILDARDPDYGTAISALALLRNHGMDEDWAYWSAKLMERDFGVPTELRHIPFPHREPFDGGPWTFERLGNFMHFGQKGSSLALNPIKSVTLDDSGLELKRRFGGERVEWSDITAGRLTRETTKKMADLVGLAGIRRTLVLERKSGAPIELDVSTCVREFEFPLQLLAAVDSKISVSQ